MAAAKVMILSMQIEQKFFKEFDHARHHHRMV